MDENDILARVRANFDGNRHDTGEHVVRQDPAFYLDPTRYRAEIDRLFREQPQFVCHASQLASPGDFVTHELAGLPLIVARGDDGQLHAHVNACLHRGARLEGADCGHRRDFTCPFHGWAYALDGRLTALTDRSSFEGAGLEQARLVPVAVAERHGLVFVRLSGEGPLELDLGEMGRQFDAIGLADHVFFTGETVVHDFNWKLAIDGSLETYHLNYAHPAAARAYTGNASLFDFYGRHTRFITAQRKLAKGEVPAAEEWRRHVMCTFHLFPNAFITTPHDHVILQTVLPLSPGRTAIRMALLKPRDAPPEFDEHWRKSWAMNQIVLADDFAIWTGIQRAYAGGFIQPALFGRFEHAIPRFHAHCEEVLSA